MEYVLLAALVIVGLCCLPLLVGAALVAFVLFLAFGLAWLAVWLVVQTVLLPFRVWRTERADQSWLHGGL
jgi:hypothetical protein